MAIDCFRFSLTVQLADVFRSNILYHCQPKVDDLHNIFCFVIDFAVNQCPTAVPRVIHVRAAIHQSMAVTHLFKCWHKYANIFRFTFGISSKTCTSISSRLTLSSESEQAKRKEEGGRKGREGTGTYIHMHTQVHTTHRDTETGIHACMCCMYVYACINMYIYQI